MSSASYTEWLAPSDLRPRVACVWAAHLGADGERHVERVIPDGCIDLVFTDGALWIAGPDTESVELEIVPNRTYVGLRFRAGASALGVPASALVNQRVRAADLLGAPGTTLEAMLAESRGAREATVELERAARDWMRRTPADALVARAVSKLAAPHRDWTLTALANDLGVSERQLRRRFVAAVGYGPKFLERVLRLRRFLQGASRVTVPGLVGLALDAGFADQPHLTRECRDLTGCTPSQLLGYPVTAS